MLTNRRQRNRSEQKAPVRFEILVKFSPKWCEKLTGAEGCGESGSAGALTNSTRARTPRPRTCHGLTRHFHILLYLCSGEARAQPGAVRWTDCRRTRYLRSPVPSPLPSGTGWHSKTKRSTKDVPRMFAPPPIGFTSKGRGAVGPGTLSDYTTPDSRAETERPVIYDRPLM